MKEIKELSRIKNKLWLGFICEKENVEYSENLVDKYEEICHSYGFCMGCILDGEDCRENFIKLIKEINKVF